MRVSAPLLTVLPPPPKNINQAQEYLQAFDEDARSDGTWLERSRVYHQALAPSVLLSSRAQSRVHDSLHLGYAMEEKLLRGRYEEVTRIAKRYSLELYINDTPGHDKERSAREKIQRLASRAREAWYVTPVVSQLMLYHALHSTNSWI
jgi:hypothetical protein